VPAQAVVDTKTNEVRDHRRAIAHEAYVRAASHTAVDRDLGDSQARLFRTCQHFDVERETGNGLVRKQRPRDCAAKEFESALWIFDAPYEQQTRDSAEEKTGQPPVTPGHLSERWFEDPRSHDDIGARVHGRLELIDVFERKCAIGVHKAMPLTGSDAHARAHGAPLPDVAIEMEQLHFRRRFHPVAHEFRRPIR
jgi:hypothetical protein